MCEALQKSYLEKWDRVNATFAKAKEEDKKKAEEMKKEKPLKKTMTGEEPTGIEVDPKLDKK